MSIACEIVKDLVPLYLDGTSSEMTGKFVRRHLKRCKSCSEYCVLCKNSVRAGESRTPDTEKNKAPVNVPDDGYKIIAQRISKSMMMERVAFICAAIAAIVTTIIIFSSKNTKDR